MDIDATIASALGFPRAHYMGVERERRWLCHEVPREQIRQTLTVTDLYVDGTRLRLREMREGEGGASSFKLTRKADVDARTRLLTTIYLPEEEFTILAGALSGPRLTKLRHRLHAPPGVLVSVDEFQGELAGLVLAEVESETADALVAFPFPHFAVREVTDELAYTGGSLVKYGVPR
jgi:CYTH domain-containing protein